MQLEIIVFAWESNGKYFFQKLNSGQLMNRKVKVPGKSFHSAGMKDVDGLESVQLGF